MLRPPALNRWGTRRHDGGCRNHVIQRGGERLCDTRRIDLIVLGDGPVHTEHDGLRFPEATWRSVAGQPGA